jgi:hypothetical protein
VYVQAVTVRSLALLRVLLLRVLLLGVLLLLPLQQLLLLTGSAVLPQLRSTQYTSTVEVLWQAMGTYFRRQSEHCRRSTVPEQYCKNSERILHNHSQISF